MNCKHCVGDKCNLLNKKVSEYVCSTCMLRLPKNSEELLNEFFRGFKK